jgi:hypothetical protein
MERSHHPCPVSRPCAMILFLPSPPSSTRIPSPLLSYSHTRTGATLPLRDGKDAFFGGKNHMGANLKLQRRPRTKAARAAQPSRPICPIWPAITMGTNQHAGLRVIRSQGSSDLALCWAVRARAPLNSDVIGLQGGLARIQVHRCTDPRHLLRCSEGEQELSCDGKQQRSRQ